MKASYATMCRCGRLIHPGDPIVPAPDQGSWVHRRCAPSRSGGVRADEGQCAGCGIIRRTHLLDDDGRCEECR